MKKIKDPVARDYKALNTLRDHCYNESKAKGWHAEAEPNIAAFCANLHGEVSELWESWRAGTLDSLCDKSDKMEACGITPLTCAAEELADVIIRALDTAATLNVDIAEAVEMKLAYNRTRPHRHGGKLA